MSILNINTNVDPTTTELQAKARIEIAEESQRLLENMTRVYNDLMSKTWKNQDGLTPQEVMDALGTDAYSLFELGTLVSTTILTVEPEAELIPKPDVTVTPGVDGSVTIS